MFQHEATFFIIIFYFPKVNVVVRNDYGVLGRLVQCILACWVLHEQFWSNDIICYMNSTIEISLVHIQLPLVSLMSVPRNWRSRFLFCKFRIRAAGTQISMGMWGLVPIHIQNRVGWLCPPNRLVPKVIMCCTCVIITRSWFETALYNKLQILLNNFLV